MDTKAIERRLYIEALLNQLRRRYVEQTPVPGGEKKALTFEMLRRLCRHIVSEGYGE